MLSGGAQAEPALRDADLDFLIRVSIIVFCGKEFPMGSRKC